MTNQVKIIVPKTNEEVEEANKLMKEGNIATGCDRPTQEQLDKYPLSFFDEDEQ